MQRSFNISMKPSVQESLETLIYEQRKINPNDNITRSSVISKLVTDEIKRLRQLGLILNDS